MPYAHIKRVALFLCLFTSLPVLSETLTIDGTTDESFKTSSEKMVLGLSEAEKKEFATALTAIVVGEAFASAGSLSASKGKDTKGDALLKVRTMLNGKSTKEVVALAANIAKERRAAAADTAKATAAKEIDRLQSKKRTSEASMVELAKFRIIKARFFYGVEFKRKQPKVELTVKNEFGQAVGRVFFHAVVTSPGRSIPWHEGDFNYQIPGGLEKNEEATWVLTLNEFLGWSRVEDRKDLEMTVTLTKMEGAKGKVLAEASFTEKDQDKLDGYLKQAEELKAGH